jgi:dynein heavy chain
MAKDYGEGTSYIFCCLISQVHQNPRVLVVCEKDTLVYQFDDCNKVMETALRSLNAFIEYKRQAFPRFYFLSNKEVLDMLASNKDPSSVQPLLKKCFEGINSLEFSSPEEISTIVSAEGRILFIAYLNVLGEKVLLSNKVNTVSVATEEWLALIEKEMRKTLQAILVKAVASHAAEYFGEWVHQWPYQIMLTANQIAFTHRVTNFNGRLLLAGITTFAQ